MTFLTLPTIAIQKSYHRKDVYLLYFATDKGEIDLEATKLWHILTGRKTIKPNDIGAFSDLTKGTVKIKWI